MRIYPVILAILSLNGAFAQTLKESFTNPPASARPHTWWHWINGNVTKEGITLDLEAMARVGIGGAQIFNVADKGSVDIPKGKVDYLSPLFLDLIKHAVTEAKRLDIEICLHNCPGWSSSGGPWIDPAHSMQLLVSSEVQAKAAGVVQLPQPETRMGYYQEIAVLAFPTPNNATFRIPDIASLTTTESKYNPSTAAIAAPADSYVPIAKVIDLTKSLQPDGSLDWSPPSPGTWTIIRFGHTSSGKTNHPASESGIGLECDKLSRAAMDLHWNKGIQPILDYLGPVGTHGLNNLLLDSYEVGPNTWTPAFRDEFTKRRGYDPLPYLPAFAGHVLDDGDKSARFLWDYRRTIADLFADHYYAYFAELCKKAGLLASVEPYDGPYECLALGSGYDIIMGEFWADTSTPTSDYTWTNTMNLSCKLTSSMAHVNGKTYVGAEAFTSRPPSGRWQHYPGMLKRLGDAAWCLGINRYIFHCFTHQPWSNEVVPGMTMGQYGTHLDRSNTWWEPAREWIQYITRSQFLLQQGRFNADVLLFGGENVPALGINRLDLKRAGHDYDAIGTDLIDQLHVENGELVLPSGMRYRLLVLPDEMTMTVPLAAKLRELVENGANLLGTKPLRTPSLDPATRSNEAPASSADALWGNPPAATDSLRQVGKGRVFHGITPEQALKKLGISPQVTAAPEIHWIHRTTAEQSIFLISNQSEKAFRGEVGFRVSGMAPALLDPLTGDTVPAQVWSAGNGNTTVSLSLPPAGSIFLVFGLQNEATPTFTRHAVETLEAAPELDLPAAKIEIRSAKYGILHDTLPRCVDVTPQLRSAVQDGSLRVVAGNHFAGDPAKDSLKSLLVEYLAGGETRTARVSENETLILPPSGVEGPIKITAAIYGDIPSLVTQLPRRKTVDLTEKLNSMIRDGKLTTQVNNQLVGRDLLFGIAKQLEVEYTLDGVPGVVTVEENQLLTLPPAPWRSVSPTSLIRQGSIESFAHERHTFTRSDATTLVIETPSPPPPVSLTGPLQVQFQANRGSTANASFERLISLHQHHDPAIRYFSGTAVYTTNFHIAENQIAHPKSAFHLDLGRVEVIAGVKLNGRDLGILWHDPFRLDVTKFLKPGSNTLEVSVTNLWVNRLIGDEQLPPDVEWAGGPLVKWPDWLEKSQPRPSKERVTFTTWHHWKKEDALKPSGLIGPVLLRHSTIHSW